MSLKLRSKRRKKRIKGFKSRNFDKAEEWDLLYWLKQTPQTRLSAALSIIDDIKKINKDKL